jgi:predicted  nucleic acid-binding Zn-ribbon protein
MLDNRQMERWQKVNAYLEEALEQVQDDKNKSRKIKNIRSKLAWALDQYESGLSGKTELLQKLAPEVAEKFQEIIG